MKPEIGRNLGNYWMYSILNINAHREPCALSVTTEFSERDLMRATLEVNMGRRLKLQTNLK